MRRIVTAVILVLGALGSITLAAQPSSAGGPTSVLVTSPSRAAAALYYTDVRYDDLERQITRSTEAEAPAKYTDHQQAYNLTWLVHDQLIWRVNRVHLIGQSVYLETTMPERLGEPHGREVTTWRKVKDGDRLLRLLEEVLGGATKDAAPVDIGSETDSDESTAGASASSTPAPPPPQSADGTTWFSLTGWRWLLPGLAVGLLAGHLARRRPVGRAARQVLIDGSPVS